MMICGEDEMGYGMEFFTVHFVLVFYLRMALTRASALSFADLLKSRVGKLCRHEMEELGLQMRDAV